MEKRKPLLKWIAAPLILALVLILNIDAFSSKSSIDEKSTVRADIIVIDALKTFGPLERAAVFFLHDQHTDRLEKADKDCKTCHLQESGDKDSLSLKFKRLKDVSKKETMDIYHAECIGCHKETAASGQPAGPVETCNDCHTPKTDLVSSRSPMAFDNSLHFRHTEANKDAKTGKGDCARCHHEYNEKTKTLYYAKEKEGSCRYCHKQTTEDKRISMKMASHLDCISCHRAKKAQKVESGPIKCMGCHDPGMQKKIEKLDRVPRMERKQPDVVLVRTSMKTIDKSEAVVRMSPVPFDHKSHETYNSTCIVCHHASLEACVQCHTQEGSKDGNFIKLEGAMHLRAKEQSCIGCHEINQQEPECAACHEFMADNAKAVAATCRTCHMDPVEAGIQTASMDSKDVARRLLDSRKMTRATFKDEDIPEKVIIKELSDKYEPAEMPHRKIVTTLMKNIGKNKLAGYFHTDAGTICQSCHHNSPLSKKPPRCGSCHGKAFDESHVFRPGLKGAFHQQCMGCHGVLKLEKPASTACADCHREKKS